MRQLVSGTVRSQSFIPVGKTAWEPGTYKTIYYEGMLKLIYYKYFFFINEVEDPRGCPSTMLGLLSDGVC